MVTKSGGHPGEEDLRNTHLSRRDRQLIRAYGSGNEESQPQGEHIRKKSKTSANRKRKRNKSIKMGIRMDMTAGSDRGLADAQEQLQQDLNSPDNGILQLVISRDGDNEARPDQIDNPPSAMVVSQLKATDKPGDGSEFDNNLIDAETRGGNLSSHGESKHYGTQSAGFNHSSIVGGHMTAGQDANGNISSAAKAGNYLNAPTAWESDTSNSVMHAHFSGL